MLIARAILRTRPIHFFDIGSINKTFTSVAVAKLVEAGRLDFDAPGCPSTSKDQRVK